MLIVAAPVYLVLRLLLIVATQTLWPPLAFEMCLAGLILIVAAPVPVDLVLGLTLGSDPSNSLLVCLKCWVVFFIKTIAISDYSSISVSKC